MSKKELKIIRDYHEHGFLDDREKRVLDEQIDKYVWIEGGVIKSKDESQFQFGKFVYSETQQSFMTVFTQGTVISGTVTKTDLGYKFHDASMNYLA